MIQFIPHHLLCAAALSVVGVGAQATTLYNVDFARDRGGVEFNASNDDSNLVYNTASPSGTSAMTWNVFNSGLGPVTTTAILTDINDSFGGASSIDVSVGEGLVDGYSDQTPKDGIWTGYISTGEFNGSGPTITLSGFNPGDTVDLVLYNGNARWAGANSASYTFGGVTKTATEIGSSNDMPLTEDATYVQFLGLVADGAGEINGTFGVPDGGSGNAVFAGLQMDVTAVPEPGSMALLALGGVCVARRRRRQ